MQSQCILIREKQREFDTDTQRGEGSEDGAERNAVQTKGCWQAS